MDYSISLHQSNSQPQLKKKTLKKKSNSRFMNSEYHLGKQQKLFRNVPDQFQFRITNQLLDSKINNPRRDKIIAQSVRYADKKSLKKTQYKKIKTDGNQDKQNKSIDTNKPKVQANKNIDMSSSQGMKKWGKRKQIERTYKTFDDINSPCHNYNNDYLLALENNRMGKRLINTRSMVQDILTKTYYSYHMYNGNILNKNKYLQIKRDSVKFRSCNKNFGKINNGIKSFFASNQPRQPKTNLREPQDNRSEHLASRGGCSRDKSRDEELNKTVILQDKTLRKKGHQKDMSHHGYQTNNPRILEAVGQGQFNFVINKLNIAANPAIKEDSILVLQVIEGYDKLVEVLNNTYAQKNNFHHFKTEKQQKNKGDHCYSSASFPYEYISGLSNQHFGIKFRIKKQTQIYIRILKNEGIQQRQLGVISISLSPFFTKQQQSEYPIYMLKQFKQIDGRIQTRKVYESFCEGKLMKLKKGVTSTQVQIQYHFYCRKYQPLIKKQIRKETQIVDL